MISKMMDITKSIEFFVPCSDLIHIIGCGAVGSTVAENLARLGIGNMILYDFDVVESHNIANQMYRNIDIGKMKVDALSDILCEINPELHNTIRLVRKGYIAQPLSGYVFLCVDDIELRKKIAVAMKSNPYIKAMFDFRIRLVDAQHYAAIWDDEKMVNDFINSMNFTNEEAKENTPVSACNLEMSIAPTVRNICAYGVANFINVVNNHKAKKLILTDSFSFTLDAF